MAIGVQQLGGAVMIIRVYSNLFQDEDGWRRVLWFSVILNVNLALLNLLPLPVLDGGHITLSLIEAVRRRPVSAKILNCIQTGFAALLITFMVYIAFFDTGDCQTWFSWWRRRTPTLCATCPLQYFAKRISRNISAAKPAKSSSAIPRTAASSSAATIRS